MTAEAHDFGQRDLVRQAASLESAHDRHNCAPIRKPATCILCQRPAPRGAMCHDCKRSWRESQASA